VGEPFSTFIPAIKAVRKTYVETVPMDNSHEITDVGAKPTGC